MATYTIETVAPIGFNNLEFGKDFVHTVPIDATEIFGDAAAAGLANGNVYKCFTPPAGTYVKEVFIEVDTIEDSAATMSIGDYASANDAAVDADGYAVTFDLTSAAGFYQARSAVLSQATPDAFNVAYHSGKIYNGAQFIGFLTSAACDTFQGKLHFLCTKVA